MSWWPEKMRPVWIIFGLYLIYILIIFGLYLDIFGLYFDYIWIYLVAVSLFLVFSNIRESVLKPSEEKSYSKFNLNSPGYSLDESLFRRFSTPSYK